MTTSRDASLHQPPSFKRIRGSHATEVGHEGNFCESLESRVLLSRVQGIDVSNWQGTINWNQVYSAGKQFAFVKATEGTTFADSTLAANEANGTDAGLLIGAYHYAHPENNSAVSEANWFLSNASPYITQGHLRPVLDIEDGSSLGATALSQWVNTFCTTVQNATGIDPIIYANTNYATNYLNSTITSHSLWIANWNDYGDPLTTGSPPTGAWSNWDFWQYSSTGTVSGISGNVDTDVFKSDLSTLQSSFEIGNNRTVVYSNGFETSAGPEWSIPIRSTTPTGGRQFLGELGGGNNAVLTGGASWTTGRTGRGSAIQLDGSTGYLDVGNDQTAGFSGNATASAWVKFNSNPAVSTPVIVESMDTNATVGFRLGVSNDGKLYFTIGNGTTFYNNKSASGGTVLQTGTWYHLVGTFNNGTITTYVNDALDRQSVTSATSMAPGQRMVIGRRKQATSNFLNGVVDDVQVFNRSLSASEAAALPDGTSNGLVAYWKMDENTGTRAYDTARAGDEKLTLNNLPSHDDLTISFDLYLMRSWDGNAGNSIGPDIWTLTADSQSLLQTTFDNGNGSTYQAYPGSYPGSSNPRTTGAAEVNTLGYVYLNNVMDSVYHLSFNFAHTSSSVVFDFFAKLEGIDNESWGLDNVVVSTHVPTISGPSNVNEGSTYTLNLDSGGAAARQWNINWGDGSDPDGDGITGQIVTGNPASVTHVYNDNGTYTISTTETDAYGNQTVPSITASVSDVAPTAVLSNNGPIDEGSLVTVSFNGVNDPSSVDMAAGLRYSFATSADDLATMYMDATTATASGFTFPDNGTYVVYGRVFDKDGYSTDYSTNVTVNYVAPTLSVTGASSATVGTTYSVNLSSSDPGMDTISAWTIDWGDNHTDSGAGALPASYKHMYESLGNYTVQLTATDEAGDHNAPTASVSVGAQTNITLAAGQYRFSVNAAQQTSASDASFEVLIDGTSVGTIQPADATDASYATQPFAISDGTHTVSFSGLDAADAPYVNSFDLNRCAEINGVSNVVDQSVYDLNLLTFPSTLPVSGWSIDWGDGSDPDGDGSVGESVGTGLPLVSHTYTSAGSYVITATASDAFGSYTVVNSITVSVTPHTPAAPDDVTATPQSGGGVLINWRDLSDNEQQFVIERSTNSDFTQDVTEVDREGPDATTALDSSAAGGVVYYYGVSAENSDGAATSAVSEPVTAPVSAPGDPGNFTANPISSSEVDLSWVAGGGQTGFRIDRSTSADFTQDVTTIATLDADAATYLDSGLSEGSYYYRLVALNGDVESNYAGAVADLAESAPPLDGSGEPAPTGLAATRISSTQIDLDWTRTDSVANTAAAFELQRSTNGSTWVSVLPFLSTADQTSELGPVPSQLLASFAENFRDLGLTTNQNYEYRIRADYAPAGTLSTGLSKGQAGITSLALPTKTGEGLAYALSSGTSLLLMSPNGDTQTVILSASAAADAHTISVNSFTANAAYAAGTVIFDLDKVSDWTTTGSVNAVNAAPSKPQFEVLDPTTDQWIVAPTSIGFVAGVPVHVRASQVTLDLFSPLQCRYLWDFNDSGSHTAAHASPTGTTLIAFDQNQDLEGFNAAHIYDTTGTRSITLTVNSPSAGDVPSDAMSVSVSADYSTPTTIKIGRSGTNYTAQVNGGATNTYSTMAALFSATPIPNDTHLYFAGGSSYDLAGHVFDFTARSNIFVGENPSDSSSTQQPVLMSAVFGTGGNSSGIFKVSASTMNLQFSNVTFESYGQTDPSLYPDVLYGPANEGQNMSFEYCTFDKIWSVVQSNSQPPGGMRGLLMEDNTTVNKSSLYSYLAYTSGLEGGVFLANTVDGSIHESDIRLPSSRFDLVDSNDLTYAGGNDKSPLRFYSGAYMYARRNRFAGGLTEFGPLPDGGVPGGGKGNKRTTFVVVDGNEFAAGGDGENHPRLDFGLQQAVIRNNLFTNMNEGGGYILIKGESSSTTWAVPPRDVNDVITNVWIVNNTRIAGASTAPLIWFNNPNTVDEFVRLKNLHLSNNLDARILTTAAGAQTPLTLNSLTGSANWKNEITGSLGDTPTTQWFVSHNIWNPINASNFNIDGIGYPLDVDGTHTVSWNSMTLASDKHANLVIGVPAGSLTTALSSGQTGIISLAVTQLTYALPAGTRIILVSATGGTQTVTVSATAAVNATSISVNSFTANAAYPQGTVITGTNKAYTPTNNQADYGARVNEARYDINGVLRPSGTVTNGAVQFVSTSKLGTPTNLAASSFSDTSITLTWTDNSSGESGFSVEESTDGGQSFTPLIPPAGASSGTGSTVTYPVTGLTEGTPYEFRVQAVTSPSSNDSDYSNTRSRTTLLSAPTGPAVTNFTDTHISLSWTNNSTHATGYNIYRSVSGGAFAFLTTLPGNSTHTFTDTVQDATTYAYTVSATTGDPTTESMQAGPVSATTYLTVNTPVFNYSPASGPMNITIQFGADVSSSFTSSSFTLANTSDPSVGTLGMVAANMMAVSYNSATNTATITFPGYTPPGFPNGILPDGNYTLTIPMANVTANGAHPVTDVVYKFFYLAADITHDRFVNNADMSILLSNFNKSGMTFSQGDTNYDGVVNALDFSRIASYNSSQLFQSSDIGTPMVSGSLQLVPNGAPPDNNAPTSQDNVIGGGTNVFGIDPQHQTGDQFQFANVSWAGNFDFKVRLAGVSAPTGYGGVPLVGIMARAADLTDPNGLTDTAAENVFMRTNGVQGGSFNFAYRSTEGTGATTSIVDVDQTTGQPRANNLSGGNTWFRLVRNGTTGDTFTGYDGFQNPNGSFTWFQVGSVTLPDLHMKPVYLGLAVCSKSTTYAVTGQFRNVYGPQ